MRKIVAAATAVVVLGTLGAAGCRTAAPAAGDAAAPIGAATPTAAVERFVEAARATDVRTMGGLFGTAAGPLGTRESAVDVEKRMRALACYLTHDAARLIDDVPGVGSGRVVTLELRQRELVRRPRFTAVAGPRGRWFVESFEIDVVADFCRPG